MKALRPLTPKEFSEAIGGLLSADTVRGMCQRGELKTARGPKRPPYFIPWSEVEQFIPSPSFVQRFLVTV